LVRDQLISHLQGSWQGERPTDVFEEANREIEIRLATNVRAQKGAVLAVDQASREGPKAHVAELFGNLHPSPPGCVLEGQGAFLIGVAGEAVRIEAFLRKRRGGAL
jgi:hypothetical protein